MKRHVSTGWFFALAAAAVLASVAGVAAGHALAAPPKDKAKSHGKHHKVKAHIKHRTLVVKGSKDDDQIVLRLRSGDPATLEVVTQDGVVGHNLRRDRFDAILVQARDGNDSVSIDETNGVFTDTETTTVDGDEGNDTLLGGRGNETFDGGPGDDSVDGNQGADVAFLGEGDDTFTWDNGDGSDVVEGQDGFDTMVFNGMAGGEIFDASANGGRLRFFRQQGNIVMDVDGTEHVDLRTLGGADSTTVNDLSATDVVEVSIDLAAAIGGNAGDGAADTVNVNGTNGADNVDILGANGGASVGGLAASTRIGNAEPDKDTPGRERPRGQRRPLRSDPRRLGHRARAERWVGERHAARRNRQRPAVRRHGRRQHRREPGQRRWLPRRRVTTPSSGITATEATWSRAEPASTRWCSTAWPAARPSTPRPTAGGCASSVSRATS